jgi:glycosyltransferase involved in cell wall biosynthesis
LKVAIVHHWLDSPRGGERVLSHLANLFPNAPVLTSIYNKRASWPVDFQPLKDRIFISPIQHLYEKGRIPLKYLVPLMPLAFHSFKQFLKAYDLVIISDAGLAKTIPVTVKTKKIVYAHTAMRHIWHSKELIKEELPPLLYPIATKCIRYLQTADLQGAVSVSSWAANSITTQRIISDTYKLDISKIRIINPGIDFLPIDDEDTAIDTQRRSGFIVVSSLVPYKRDELTVAAATKIGFPLKVIGDGPELQKLKSIAGPNVIFMGFVSDQELKELYRSSEGLIFAGQEDFGLVPVEAMAQGCPVLAFNSGGATETVVDGIGGLFFDLQTVDTLIEGLRRMRAHKWIPREVALSVSRFSRKRFELECLDWIGDFQ